ncbi:hypothetical protein NP233_g10279 [Leucocoprinus birnbaumii]|uniref:mRNA stability protein n=1 Tax=Leucocoprinus birnbaumii TaxID=56174 RepID=A0AAD5VKM7_9AGAR|nr:hypothetical protein NP233_g10279 [Leucocoprinus birnbaumii]
MLPAQRNKVDISVCLVRTHTARPAEIRFSFRQKLTPQEQQLFAKYGKLPTHKNILMKMQKERKYFDSGDYALSKAGVTPQSTVGTAIPNPENIPHASPVSNGHQIPSVSPTSTSPINRESSLSQMNVKPVEAEGETEEGEEANKEDKSPQPEPSTSEMVTSTTIEVETPDTTIQETTIETQEVKDVDMAI